MLLSIPIKGKASRLYSILYYLYGCGMIITIIAYSNSYMNSLCFSISLAVIVVSYIFLAPSLKPKVIGSISIKNGKTYISFNATKDELLIEPKHILVHYEGCEDEHTILDAQKLTRTKESIIFFYEGEKSRDFRPLIKRRSLKIFGTMIDNWKAAGIPVVIKSNSKEFKPSE